MDNILNILPKKITVDKFNVRGKLVSEERYVRRLDEASINRILDHAKDEGIVIISANRSAVFSSNPNCSLEDEFIEKYGPVENMSEKEFKEKESRFLQIRNAAEDRHLKQDIKNAGYSFTPVYGGYHGSDDVQDSYEPSYIVYNKKKGGETGNFEDLERFAIDMCKKYRQDSVYVQRPGEPPMYLNADGEKTNKDSTNKVKINREDEEYYTTASRDKNSKQRFTADFVFESAYQNLKPASLSERRRRCSTGEIIL